MSKKRLWLLVLALSMVLPAAYAPTADAHTSISNWTSSNHGFFKHNAQGSGWWNVWPSSGGRSGCQGNGNALPTWVNTASEFIAFVKCKLGGNTQERVGAAFIISTIIGEININPSASQISEFEGRINYAASKGWINFSVSLPCNPGSPPRNTFYQPTHGDVAWYSGCPVDNSGRVMTNYSAVTIAGGSSTYIIARLCANPIGSMTPIADDLEFNMSGTSTVNVATASPGQTVRFTHRLTNSGPTSTSPHRIQWWTMVGPSPSAPWSQWTSLVGNTNPGTGPFADDQTITVVNGQNYPIPTNATNGSRVCQRIHFVPNNTSWGTGQSTPACVTVIANNLTPSIRVLINGVVATGAPIFAEPGDTLLFQYFVNNSNTSTSGPASCTYRQVTHTGFSTTAPSASFVPPGNNCPAPSGTRTFPASSNTQTAQEGVDTTPLGNRSLCRSLTVQPATSTGASRTAQTCVHLGTKPYFHVYGGDISAGAGVETPADSGVCTQNAQAAMAGWNRLGAGGWAGAGAQYAAYALARIYQVASSAWGSAQAPAGLSFANTTTTDIPAGDFGGRFGSVPCITDYYDTKPTDLSDSMSNQNLDSYGTGIHFNNGDIYFNGPGGITTIDPGQETVIYVNGNVHLNSNVHYTGSWNPANIPIFRLIVRGNIYIDAGVTRLDGIFIAQPSGSSNGIIYTCASANPAPFTAPGTANFPTTTVRARCASKLTVNGSFIAKQVQLWRTPGTVRQSSSGEPSGSANIAEVFNYSPALWINQPELTGRSVPDYDAIVSLPPVL